MSSNQPTNPNEGVKVPYYEHHNTAGSSATYHSYGNTTLTKFQRIHNHGRILGLTNSPFYPQTVQEYGTQQALYAADKAEEEHKRLNNRIAALAAITTSVNERGLKGEAKEREKLCLRISELMKPMDFSGRTAVLAKKSVWVPGAEKESTVTWPCRDESKYEGEQQARQGLPRRVPLPRERKLKAIDRSEMINAGHKDEVEKMERGETPIPWRMKEVAEVEGFDETKMGREDRVNKGLEKFELIRKEHSQQIADEEVLEKGWLRKDLLDEL